MGVSNNAFFVLFQPGHLAIPEAYTRSPDLLPHRTDLTIQDVVRPFPTTVNLFAIALCLWKECSCGRVV